MEQSRQLGLRVRIRIRVRVRVRVRLQYGVMVKVRRILNLLGFKSVRFLGSVSGLRLGSVFFLDVNVGFGVRTLYSCEG